MRLVFKRVFGKYTIQKPGGKGHCCWHRSCKRSPAMRPRSYATCMLSLVRHFWLTTVALVIQSRMAPVPAFRQRLLINRKSGQHEGSGGGGRTPPLGALSLRPLGSPEGRKKKRGLWTIHVVPGVFWISLAQVLRATWQGSRRPCRISSGGTSRGTPPLAGPASRISGRRGRCAADARGGQRKISRIATRGVIRFSAYRR